MTSTISYYFPIKWVYTSVFGGVVKNLAKECNIMLLCEVPKVQKEQINSTLMGELLITRIQSCLYCCVIEICRWKLSRRLKVNKVSVGHLWYNASRHKVSAVHFLSRLCMAKICQLGTRLGNDIRLFQEKCTCINWASYGISRLFFIPLRDNVSTILY